MIKPGTILKGRYEVRDRIARGGFATVYNAWDSTFERRVAVKVVDLGGDEDGELQNGQELLKEARFVANYHHPNILDVYDFGDVEDQTYLVMPLADGGTLHQLLRSAGPLSFEQADQYLQQIASGLDHAHRLKVVHRDLKPQNLLLFGPEKQHLVISDFGVAKAVSQTNVASARITGTPRYMSPEQFLGRAGYSSDIYALGIVLYQMLAGETPFQGDQAELLYAHTTVAPPSLSLKRSGIPPELDQLLQRTMAKDPNQRPKSAGELSHSFQQIIVQNYANSTEVDTIAQPLNKVNQNRQFTRPFSSPVSSGSSDTEATAVTPTPSSSKVEDDLEATAVTPIASSEVEDELEATAVTPTPSSSKVEPDADVTTVTPPLPVPVAVSTSNFSQAVSTPVVRKGIPPIALIGGAVVALVVGIGLILAIVVGAGGGSSSSKLAATATIPVLVATATAPATISPAQTTVATAPVTTNPAVITTSATAALVTTAAIGPTVSPTKAVITTAPAQTTYPLPANGDPVLTASIEIWTDDLQNPEEASLLAENIAGFNKLFPNVKITVKPLNPGEVLENKVARAMQAGNGPDLVIAPVGQTGEWATNKLIRPVQDLLDKNFLANFEPNALAGSNVAGVGYGLPYNYGNILMLYYNKKLVAAPPNTFEDLIKQARNLTKGNQLGLALNREDYFWLLPFLDAYEGWPVDNAGQVTLNTDPMKNALQYFKDLATQFPTGYDEANRAFIDGRLAFFINGDWELDSYQKPEVKSKLEVGVAPIPTINNRTPHSMTGGRHYFLSAKAEGDRLKAALYFMQFRSLSEQQKQLIQLGLIPPTRDGLNSAEVKNRPQWSAVIDQLKGARVQPVRKGMVEIWTAIAAGMKAVQEGSATPVEAAAKMQETATKP